MTGNYPQYTVHWKTRVGELTAVSVYMTPITGLSAKTAHITLTMDGTLTLQTGYVWDFGSGPAIDTPAMVYASLAHDAFYELLVTGLLAWGNRKDVDRYFKRLLKEGRMPWLRRQWVYAGVRLGYPILKFFGRMGKS